MSIFEYDDIFFHILDYLKLNDIKNLIETSKKISEKFELEKYFFFKIEKCNNKKIFINKILTKKMLNINISLKNHDNDTIKFMIAFKLLKEEKYINSLKLIENFCQMPFILLKIFNNFKLKKYDEVDELTRKYGYVSYFPQNEDINYFKLKNYHNILHFSNKYNYRQFRHTYFFQEKDSLSELNKTGWLYDIRIFLENEKLYKHFRTKGNSLKEDKISIDSPNEDIINFLVNYLNEYYHFISLRLKDGYKSCGH